MKNPEIRISYSWLLAQGPSEVLAKEYNADRDYTDEDYRKWSDDYRNEWTKHERQILTAMQEVFGLEFYSGVIDVSLAPWFVPQSDPMIINLQYEPDQFVDVLTHELLHVLLTDNRTYSMKSSPRELNLAERWEKLFGAREFNELVHIPVHAASKYIYLDVLGQQDRLHRDIEDVRHLPAYKAAWEYVESHDYKQIIQLISEDFAAIRR